MVDSKYEERLGFFANLTIAVVAIVLAGTVAALLGYVVQPFSDDDRLTARLVTLSVIDALGIVAILYSRRVEGAEKTKRRQPPLLIALKFAGLGLTCGHGNGAFTFLACGIVNGGIGGFAVTIILHHRLPSEQFRYQESCELEQVSSEQ